MARPNQLCHILTIYLYIGLLCNIWKIRNLFFKKIFERYDIVPQSSMVPTTYNSVEKDRRDWTHQMNWNLSHSLFSKSIEPNFYIWKSFSTKPRHVQHPYAKQQTFNNTKSLPRLIKFLRRKMSVFWILYVSSIFNTDYIVSHSVYLSSIRYLHVICNLNYLVFLYMLSSLVIIFY